MFARSEMAFSPGLYANRSKRASKMRWVDGNLVRFRDGVPAQVGGWRPAAAYTGAIVGLARTIFPWKTNSQIERLAAVGTEKGAFLYNGDVVTNITPTAFVPGSTTSVVSDGFGTGSFGVSTYGTPRVFTGGQLDCSSWSFDAYGELLLGQFNTDGKFYKFDRATDTELEPVGGAPTGRAILVSDERHVFMFGCDGKPGYVRWSDREDYAQWTPAATNRAGGYELPVRSAFQCGVRVRGQVLGLTKTEAFAFTPLNNALVYSKDRVSTEAGSIGPRAVAVVTDSQSETAYFMGLTNFFAYDGLVRGLDCELRDYVFNDINLLQGAKVSAGVNTAFDEIWWFYCSAGSDECDRGVIYNYVTGTWSKANIARVSWADAGVFENPLAVGPDGTLYRHEYGDDANGEIMQSFIESFPITIGVGEQFADVDQWWPDMQDGSAAAKVSFICRTAPGGDEFVEGPFDFAIGDEFVPLSFSAREFDLRIDGNGAWELGMPQISLQGGALR